MSSSMQKQLQQLNDDVKSLGKSNNNSNSSSSGSSIFNKITQKKTPVLLKSFRFQSFTDGYDRHYDSEKTKTEIDTYYDSDNDNGLEFKENFSNLNLKSLNYIDSNEHNITANNSNLNTPSANTESAANNVDSNNLDNQQNSQHIKRYGVKRHHSAPQSDLKCLQAKRKAIITQMFDTEKSYVEALKNLVTKYYLPLKEKDIVERNLINDIFYKIPEIHVHHELLLSALKAKLDTWDIRQTIGDLLLNVFAKQSVIETYISFVNNFHTSQEAFRICKDQSSIFNKFIEQQAKDHRGKLTLKDLIIQPVQRIPRYELYIKDFLKCTQITHPDYQLLVKAQKELHALAEKIDQVHKEVHEVYGGDTQSCLQIIQDLIDNLDGLISPYRYYIRHDMLTIVSSSGVKKDRCIFLFSDLIILTSCKRRSGNLNKRTNSIILNSPLGKQYLESVKHKFFMKIQFEDVDITGSSLTKKQSFDKDHLEDDLNLLSKINDLAKNIIYPHHNLDESIKEAMYSITKIINDPGTTSQASVGGGGLGTVNSNNASAVGLTDHEYKANMVSLTINTTDKVETMSLVFSTQDQKSSWEKCFTETKKNFFESYSRKPATFINNIAIPRNRSGIQFTCASPRSNVNNEPNDIWICSTDGQMGQICIMNTTPEFSVQSCNTVCSSRISTVLCVPPLKIVKRGSISVKSPLNLQESIKENPDEERNSTINSKVKAKLSEQKENDEHQSDTADSSDEDDGDSQSGTEKEPPQRPNAISIPPPTITTESKNCTMWIGTDDGFLYVFQFNDTSVRTIARKNRITKQLPSSVLALTYLDNKVFVALSNGELAVFSRDHFGTWNFDNYVTKTISRNPITCMLIVAGKLWCANGDSVVVLNPSSLVPEHNLTIEGEKKLILATGGNTPWGVWVASQHNLDIRLYHATKYTILAEINIRQCLTQKFMYVDELIRLHKISCLKITCLHVCKDTLWIGSSAGIILNVKIPHITNTTTKLNTVLNYIALSHGHIGPVRFITGLEIAKQNQPGQTPDKDSHSMHKTYVLAGGEGYEEYKSAIHSSGTIQTNLNITNGSTSTFELIHNTQATVNSSTNAMQASNGSINMSTPQSTIPSTMQAGSSPSLTNEDMYLGKDDLTNYVLVWEV